MGKRKTKSRSNSTLKTTSYFKRFQVKFARRRVGESTFPVPPRSRRDRGFGAIATRRAAGREGLDARFARVTRVLRSSRPSATVGRVIASTVDPHDRLHRRASLDFLPLTMRYFSHWDPNPQARRTTTPASA